MKKKALKSTKLSFKNSEKPTENTKDCGTKTEVVTRENGVKAAKESPYPKKKKFKPLKNPASNPVTKIQISLKRSVF